jgi:colicin import membrane protein
LAAAGQSAKQGRAGGGSQLAGDLESALRAQIYPCWQEPADPSPRLIVTIQIQLAQNGNVVGNPVLLRPTNLAGADGRLLVAVDNAKRAIEQCAPFDLPKDRYSQWRVVNFSFDKRKAAQR